MARKNEMNRRGQGRHKQPGMARPLHWQGAWVVAVLICSLGVIHAQTTAHRSAKIKTDPTLSSGQRTFESSCAPCHGLNGKGGERGPDIVLKSEIVSLQDSEILKILRDGKTQAGMPSFGALGPAGLSGIVKYLRSLQGKREVPAAPASTEAGRLIFTTKAGCSECHMVRGTGGFVGPDLSNYGESHSADDIRGAIASAAKRPMLRKGLVKATTNDGRQIIGAVRNEDNFSVQLQALDGTFYSLEKSSLTELVFDSAPLMPSDYGSRLSRSDLDQLVAYLVSIRNSKQ